MGRKSVVGIKYVLCMGSCCHRPPESVLGGGGGGEDMNEGCPVLDVLEIDLDHPGKVVYGVAFTGVRFPLTTLTYFAPPLSVGRIRPTGRIWAHQAGPFPGCWTCNQMPGYSHRVGHKGLLSWSFFKRTNVKPTNVGEFACYACTTVDDEFAEEMRPS